MNATTASTSELAKRLVQVIAGYDSCAVAFSGGVDSVVVAKAAHIALGDRAVAVTGIGPAVSAQEQRDAESSAAEIGIVHVTVATDEIHQPAYIQNDASRCYHCKTELYSHVEQVARDRNLAVIVNGANADDQGDHRPGMRAADEHNVRSPLAECNFDKKTVRQLAAYWQLQVWDKPASPCLASRIAYGEAVTPERLNMVEQAESLLRELGLREFRVRYHSGDLARIEVPVTALEMLASEPARIQLNDQMRAIGFRYVTLDLGGFSSGNLNTLLPAESLQRWQAKPSS